MQGILTQSTYTLTDSIGLKKNCPLLFLKAQVRECNQRGTDDFLSSVVNLCQRTRNDWYRVYLIRKIGRDHGVDFVLKLLKEREVRWLFPEEVLLKVASLTVRLLPPTICFWNISV